MNVNKKDWSRGNQVQKSAEGKKPSEADTEMLELPNPNMKHSIRNMC